MRAVVILSGCGFQDGSEIHEAVLTLLALDRQGVDVSCYAPAIRQARVTNHLTGKATSESRDVLVESARIARGKIADLAQADPDEADAVFLPGGAGAATNLSTFATEGPAGSVQKDLARYLKAVHAAGKPIGAICIAPVVLALLLGQEGPRVTIGTDRDVASSLEACGATHETCPVEKFVVDEKRRLVTTPAYMLGPSIRHVAEGIEGLVKAVLRLANQPAFR